VEGPFSTREELIEHFVYNYAHIDQAIDRMWDDARGRRAGLQPQDTPVGIRQGDSSEKMTRFLDFVFKSPERVRWLQAYLLERTAWQRR
jgi:hypothetical protein